MQNFCSKCGNPINECTCVNEKEGQPLEPKKRFKALKRYFVLIKDWLGVGEPEHAFDDCYEQGKKIVPDSILSNDREIPVRQYNIAKLRTRLKFMQAEGRLQVTNQRVIFRASGRSLLSRTTLQHEFAIEEIAGIEIHKDSRFSLLTLFLLMFIFNPFSSIALIPFFICTSIYKLNAIIGIMFSLVIGFACLFTVFKLEERLVTKIVLASSSSAAFLAIIVGIGTGAQKTTNTGLLLFYLLIVLISALIGLITTAIILVCTFLYCYRPNLVINIKTKGGSGAIEICRDKTLGLFANKNKGDYTGFAEVMPWEDTDKAIRELGAMIMDIRQLGDEGAKKWKDS